MEVDDIFSLSGQMWAILQRHARELALTTTLITTTITLATYLQYSCKQNRSPTQNANHQRSYSLFSVLKKKNQSFMENVSLFTNITGIHFVHFKIISLLCSKVVNWVVSWKLFLVLIQKRNRSLLKAIFLLPFKKMYRNLLCQLKHFFQATGVLCV